MEGKVYIVGGGPGDPGLITVKGLEILRQGDVIICDSLVGERILENAKERAEIIRCEKLSRDEINNLMIQKAKEGKLVVRLKGGDPSIFGRLSQELEVLTENGIEYEIVPGVTSATAGACLSGIPLTDRKIASSVVFVTGNEDPNKESSLLDWSILSKAGTIVLYMALGNLEKIVRSLIEKGKSIDTPTAIVQNISLINQKIVTGTLRDILQKAKENNINPPCIIIIGDVVKFEEKFNFLKRNRKILFTGLSKERFYMKGTYFHLPLIKIEPLEDYREFDGYLKNIKEFHWIVFVSRYGVEYFFKRFYLLGYDSRALSGIKIAAIGSSTKSRLLDFGIMPDLIPKKESSDGLVEEFKKVDLEDKKIFLPRSDLSDKGLKEKLSKLGARVIESIAYKNVMPKNLPDLDFDFFDEIVFTSPSGVRNFIKRYGIPPKKIKISCIGEVTLREAKKWNLLDSED